MRAASYLAGIVAAATGLWLVAGGGESEGSQRARICHPGFAAAGRPDSEAYRVLREAAFLRAGKRLSEGCHEYQSSTNCYVLDHIVPRCLDGPNDLTNLQLQACTGWTGYRCVSGPSADKDQDEVRACHDYCHGLITLPDARERFHREDP